MQLEKKTGLIYSKNYIGGAPYWHIDICSSEVGFEIAFRPSEIHATDRVISDIKKAFMKPFALPEENNFFESTFWWIYWDKGGLPLHLLKECEKGMDTVARKYGILIEQNGTTILIRPKEYILEKIANNKACSI